MNAADQLRLSQHEQVGSVSDIDSMILKPLAAITFFGWVVRHDQRPHRAVDDEDTLFEKFADIRAIESHSNSLSSNGPRDEKQPF